MNIRSKEYDAFGPWIYVIDDVYTLPRLFEPYKTQLDGALMSFKIPRAIERRRANPHMHLYDAVVALFDTHIVMLNRLGDRVIESQIQINDIVAIENSHVLLLGRVTLYIENDFVEIKYNSVSKDIINQFVDIIRTHIDFKEQEHNLPFLDYNTKTIDYLFAHLVNGFRKMDSSIGLVAYQPKYELKVKKGIFSNIMRGFKYNQRITCTAFLVNKKEVIIINRSSPQRRRNKDNYAYSYIYLPIHNIDSAKITQKDDDTLYELCIKVHDHEFVSDFNDSNKGIKDLKDYLDRV